MIRLLIVEGVYIKRNNVIAVLCFILIISLVISPTPFKSIQIVLKTSAENKEFKMEKFNENLTLPYGGVKTIDINLENGTDFEIIYTIQVKEGLPIDLWLVNEDNYLLLISDVNFLYYIDGSDQEVSYTKKIVSLKEEGLYKLVMANIYNNQTVTANVIYDIRNFQANSDKTPSDDISIFWYPMIIAIIILAVLSTILLVKVRKLKQEKEEVSKKALPKKRPKKRKTKKPKPKIEKETIPEERPKNVIPKEKFPKITEDVNLGFCGYCGESVSTPFCKNCGKKV
jgi:hypothetical protein